MKLCIDSLFLKCQMSHEKKGPPPDDAVTPQPPPYSPPGEIYPTVSEVGQPSNVQYQQNLPNQPVFNNQQPVYVGQQPLVSNQQPVVIGMQPGFSNQQPTHPTIIQPANPNPTNFVVAVDLRNSRSPTNTECPNCHKRIVTKVEYVNSRFYFNICINKYAESLIYKIFFH